MLHFFCNNYHFCELHLRWWLLWSLLKTILVSISITKMRILLENLLILRNKSFVIYFHYFENHFSFEHFSQCSFDEKFVDHFVKIYLNFSHPFSHSQSNPLLILAKPPFSNIRFCIIQIILKKKSFWNMCFWCLWKLLFKILFILVFQNFCLFHFFL